MAYAPFIFPTATFLCPWGAFVFTCQWLYVKGIAPRIRLKANGPRHPREYPSTHHPRAITSRARHASRARRCCPAALGPFFAIWCGRKPRIAPSSPARRKPHESEHSAFPNSRDGARTCNFLPGREAPHPRGHTSSTERPFHSYRVNFSHCVSSVHRGLSAVVFELQDRLTGSTCLLLISWWSRGGVFCGSQWMLLVGPRSGFSWLLGLVA